jgi:peroxisomal membrane protein 4
MSADNLSPLMSPTVETPANTASTPTTTFAPQQPAAVVLNENYKILLDALGAFRNGIVYGTKVRAPHSFVVYALWSSSSWATVFRKIVTLTTQHALNLAFAASMFKIGLAILKKLTPNKQQLGWHYALMGAVGGCTVWGDNNPVNVQVNMYMMSRVMSGLLFLWIEYRERIAAAEKKTEEQQQQTSKEKESTGVISSNLSDWEQFAFGPKGYRVFVGVIWATALWLFHHHNQHMQSSLKMSMQYIAVDTRFEHTFSFN